MLAARSAITCKDAGSDISFANALRASVVCWPSRIISRSSLGAEVLALSGICVLRTINTEYQRRPFSERHLAFQLSVGSPHAITMIVFARSGDPARLRSKQVLA